MTHMSIVTIEVLATVIGAFIASYLAIKAELKKRFQYFRNEYRRDFQEHLSVPQIEEELNKIREHYDELLERYKILLEKEKDNATKNK